MSDWKKFHAEKSEEALQHQLVVDVMEELRRNLGAQEKSLEVYGIAKVATYAAQVARAQALGFDPDLLRMSPEEADAEILNLAERAALSGKPVYVIETEPPF